MTSSITNSGDPGDDPNEEAPDEDGSGKSEGGPEAVEDPEMGQRLWIRAILATIDKHTCDEATSPRVQFAIDRLTIAACERGIRILNSDAGEPL